MSLKCLKNGLEVNYPSRPICELFGDCVTAFEAQKKANVRTNADAIRAMSDVELAEFLECLADNGNLRIREWLQLPAASRGNLEPETIKVLKAIHELPVPEIVRICNLYQAEKEGRLVAPPCKVGDTVYFLLLDAPFYYPNSGGWYISEHVVTEVCTRGFCVDPIGDDEPILFYPYSTIGVDVFLHREDAAAELERKSKRTLLHTRIATQDETQGQRREYV